jgi:hypothetical protein
MSTFFPISVQENVDVAPVGATLSAYESPFLRLPSSRCSSRQALARGASHETTPSLKNC